MDALLFILSKTLTVLMFPSTWLVLLPGLAFLCWHIKLRVLSKVCWVVEIALVAVIGFFPVGEWLAWPLENFSTSPEGQRPPDGIIVLGGAWLTETSDEWSRLELNHAAERDITLVSLAHQYPEAELVFTGGSGRLFSQELKEADLARALYQSLQIPESRVMFESESRNTFENAQFSQRMVSPTEDQTWWLITSAYHMPRSQGVFCKVGWHTEAYPVDYFFSGFKFRPAWNFSNNLWVLDRVFREWVGLMAYRMLGRTNEIFPTECR